MKKVTREQFANNALWKFLEIIIKKAIGLIISTILARLLDPGDYGVVALTTVFITFSDIFILNGFNVALIRKEYVDEDDYSTIMLLSLIFTVLLYLVFFVSAPLVASFYRTPELEGVLRVVTVLLFFQAISTVIRAKATRELRFREMSIIAVIENIVAGIVGLCMAYKGFGVWSLVAQQLTASFFDMILLSISFRWKYRILFRWRIIREMMPFTLGVLGSAFMDFLGNNANSLVVGRAYSSKELGYMNRGNMYPEVIGLNTYSAINSVLLPTLSSRQNNIDEMRIAVRKIVSMTEYLLIPMMLGLACVSRNFIITILTEKWLPCLWILVFSCLNYIINPIRSIGYNVFYALGKSKITVKVEVFRVIAMLLNLIITIIALKQTINKLVFFNVIISFFVALLSHKFVKKEIGYTYKELFMDLFPSLMLAMPMVVIVIIFDLVLPHSITTLLLQMLIGGTIYILGSVLFKNPSYTVIKGIVHERTHHK